jgi:G3E family GTPase
LHATEKRKINNLIRDLKKEVKNYKIDLSKIKQEDRKYFNFVKFQSRDKAEKITKEHHCNEHFDIHEACCNFDNVKYVKDNNKTKENFKKYIKTFYERSPQKLIKSKNLDEADKTKKILFKNYFSNFQKTDSNNFRIYRSSNFKKAIGIKFQLFIINFK